MRREARLVGLEFLRLLRIRPSRVVMEIPCAAESVSGYSPAI